MECTLQWRLNNSNEEYPNKSGRYLFLVDAYPVDQGTTRIVVSDTIAVPGTVSLAARNWATGENMGCPDMTQ